MKGPYDITWETWAWIVGPLLGLALLLWIGAHLVERYHKRSRLNEEDFRE